MRVRPRTMILRKFSDRSSEAFKDWLGQRLPDCKTVTPAISSSLDGETGLWRRLMIRLHLFTCDRCGRYLDQIRFMSRTVRENTEDLAEAEKCELGETFKKKLKDVLDASMMSVA